MANITKSGIVAVGAPYSPIRFIKEAQHAFNSENPLNVLCKTEEGQAILKFFVCVFFTPTYKNERTLKKMLEHLTIDHYNLLRKFL